MSSPFALRDQDPAEVPETTALLHGEERPFVARCKQGHTEGDSIVHLDSEEQLVSPSSHTAILKSSW